LAIDHPEIEDFVVWKMKEEKKVAALIDAGYDSDLKARLTELFLVRIQTIL